MYVLGLEITRNCNIMACFLGLLGEIGELDTSLLLVVKLLIRFKCKYDCFT